MAIILASRQSVLASVPVALAKSLTWRGLTTATGIFEEAKIDAPLFSKPPVASRTTRAGLKDPMISTSSDKPVSVCEN